MWSWGLVAGSALDELAEAGAGVDSCESEEDVCGDRCEGDAAVASFDEVEVLLGECGERRVAAAEPHDEPRAKPLRGAMPVYERGDDEPDGEASGDVMRNVAQGNSDSVRRSTNVSTP